MVKTERKDRAEKPPALYDLTSLQRDANRQLGFTAQQTLDYTQSLYEKKLVTYPRTDSRYLTEDMAGMLCLGLFLHALSVRRKALRHKLDRVERLGLEREVAVPGVPVHQEAVPGVEGADGPGGSTLRVGPYLHEKSRVALMPTIQSARSRHRAASYKAS